MAESEKKQDPAQKDADWDSDVECLRESIADGVETDFTRGWHVGWTWVLCCAPWRDYLWLLNAFEKLQEAVAELGPGIEEPHRLSRIWFRGFWAGARASEVNLRSDTPGSVSMNAPEPRNEPPEDSPF